MRRRLPALAQRRPVIHLLAEPKRQNPWEPLVAQRRLLFREFNDEELAPRRQHLAECQRRAMLRRLECPDARK